MADAEKAKAGEDDAALLAVEATEPVVLQEPERVSDDVEQNAKETLRAPQPVVRRRGILAYVVGAALLAGAGFGVAKYVFPDTGSADAVAALQTQLDAQATTDTKLQSDIAKLAERPLPDATLADRIAALEAAVTAVPDTIALEARLATLEDRLTAIEAASAGGEGAPAAALAAMSRELTGLKAALEAQKGAGSALTAGIEAASAAAQARLDAAEAAANSAAKQAALSHIRAAFESGAPLGPALEGLKSLGAAIPETLASATEGLPSLLSLQDGFAEPARAALDASIRADMGEGWTDRLSAFLRSQSGARSLTPREGTDPDAVLSRAEAALRDGQIKAALAELAGLPPAGAEAMAPWVADATRRLDAEQAIADLSAALNGQ
jgi:hypothetical protein